MFIARISKGRTIREYLLGAIVIPTLLSTVWFSVLGHSAIQSLQDGTIDLKTVLQTDHATIFFVFLSQYSGGILLYGLAILCLKFFFITSADSAAFVIATMANEKGKPSTKGKTYWSIAICFVAITLLASGGLDVMQIVSIVSSIPFAFVSLLMLGCLFKELRAEVRSNT
jgi:glycine betaine transporter